MIFSPSAAVAAYRRSKYDRIEWQIAQTIGENSYPWLGGLGSWAGGLCNRVARPFKVGWAFLSGSGGGLKDVELTEIPSGMAGTQYETDLCTMRGALRQNADASVLKWTSFCKLRIGESYRHEAVEKHVAAKIERGLIMPTEIELGALASPSGGSARGQSTAQVS